MTQSRRDATQTLSAHSSTNAGLWLDKYLMLDYVDQEVTPQAKLVDEIANQIRSPQIYQSFFERWKRELEAAGAICKDARVLGRLVINLGDESVLETSIALHHTYGVPYIPGSALKGLAAYFARNYLEDAAWESSGKAYRVMFGDPDHAGYVNFFDALYVPNTGHKGRALWPDVITVHHPDYYQTDSNPPPPADWDNTTPIPFLSATGNYLISLAGPNEWVEKAFDILELALRKQGIGAKTSSGYGRMSFGNFSFAKAQRVETYAVAKNRLLSESPPSGRYRGTVTNVRGSFAFINQAKGGAQMFVHSSQIRGNLPLREGQVVEYRIGQHNGEDQAQDVEILLEPDD